MSDLILPEHMAKARRKEKAKIAEKGKTAAEIEEYIQSLVPAAQKDKNSDQSAS